MAQNHFSFHGYFKYKWNREKTQYYTLQDTYVCKMELFGKLGMKMALSWQSLQTIVIEVWIKIV